MNKTHRLIWSDARQTWIVAHEAAATHGKPASRQQRLLGALACTFASALLVGAAQAAPPTQAVPPAHTLPSGGQVLAGQASVSQSGNSLSVLQSSDKAILNWQSFNIGSAASVNFLQPAASSVALNRVLGGSVSQIDGRLSANGQVFLVNPSGVLFGAGARVDVGGLVASSLDIGNADFLAGRYRFNRNGASGSVVNQGELTGSYIALLAPEVRNEGIVAARTGSVTLAAGEAVTLGISGNALIDVQVDQASLDTLVENKHLIQAEAGSVILSAQSARGLLGQVVNSGKIDASGIESTGGNVRLVASANIDHSGQIDVSAAKVGAGGTAILIADLTNPASRTTVTGSISAQGGSVAGDGGFIETSATQLGIADSARITTAASSGKAGQWLLDPDDFTIAASGGNITGAALVTALGSGNVTIQTTTGAVSCTGATCGSGTAGNGDITVNDNVSWSANTLTLDAWRNIDVKGKMTLTGTAGLAVQYGQSAVAANNTAMLRIGQAIDLASTASYTSKFGSDGATKTYTVITGLGAEGSTTNADLQGITTLTANYVLGANIDASGTSSWNASAGFTPIGAFTGTFEGLGHSITGLTISRSDNAKTGLFSEVGSGGRVQNLDLKTASVANTNTNSDAYVGILAGRNVGTIAGVTSSGTISTAYLGGGLVGGVGPGGVLERSASSASVTGGDATAIGGLVGLNYGTIRNVFATGTVTGTGTAGPRAAAGLIGDTSSGGGTLTNGYASGSVSGLGTKYGLVGAGSGTVTNGYYNSETTGQSDTNLSSAPKTSAEMLVQGTFSGWDFTTLWKMGSSAPVFQVGSGTTTTTPSAPAPAPAPSYDPPPSPYFTGSTISGSQAVANIGTITGGNANYTLTPATAANNNTVTLTQTGGNGLYYIWSGFTVPTGYTLNYSQLTSGTQRGAHNSITSSSATQILGKVQSNGPVYFYNPSGMVFGTGASVDVPSLTAIAMTPVIPANEYGSISYSGTAGQVRNQASLTLGQTGGSGQHLLHGSDVINDGSLTVAGNGSLTLQVDGAIKINAPITLAGSGALALNYGSSSDYQIGAPINLGSGNRFSTQQGSNAATSYTIITDLAGLRAMNSTTNYALGADIDASATGATGGTTFSRVNIGSYGGANKTLAGLGHAVNQLKGNGFIYDLRGTVRDIGMIGVDIAGENYSGGLANFMIGGSIHNSYVTGRVSSSSSSAGGLVGVSNTGSISNSYSTAAVSGGSAAGGLVGIALYSGSINNSYASGAVNGSIAGGLVGWLRYSSSISNSFASGTVNGSSSATRSLKGQEDGGGNTITASRVLSASEKTLAASYAGFDFTTIWASDAGNTTPYLRGLPRPPQPYLTGSAISGSQTIANIGTITGGNATYTLTPATAANNNTVTLTQTGGNGLYYIWSDFTVPSNYTLNFAQLTGDGQRGAHNSITSSSATQILGKVTSNGPVYFYNPSGIVFGMGASVDVPSLTAIAMTPVIPATSSGSISYSGTAGQVRNQASLTLGQTGGSGQHLLHGSDVINDGSLTVAGNGSLTLQADGAIKINAPITLAGSGALALNYGGDYHIGAPVNLGSGNSFSTQQGSNAVTRYSVITDLAGLRAMNSSTNYAIGADIDASATAATGGTLFSAVDMGTGTAHKTLAGLGHAVSQLKGNGFVGTLYGAARDIGMIGVDIVGTGDSGGLVGYLASGSISNSYANGTVSSSGRISYAGGLVGAMGNSSISNSYASGTVSSSGSASDVGGLVGVMHSGSINNSYASGTVSSSGVASYAGGLVGLLGSASISNSYANGTVNATGTRGFDGNIVLGYANGLVGFNANGQITASRALSANEKTMAASYAGFDFTTIWASDPGSSTPYLRGLPRPTSGLSAAGNVTAASVPSTVVAALAAALTAPATVMAQNNYSAQANAQTAVTLMSVSQEAWFDSAGQITDSFTRAVWAIAFAKQAITAYCPTCSFSDADFMAWVSGG